MTETVPTLVENSLRIAWDYLEATGELGNPDTACAQADPLRATLFAFVYTIPIELAGESLPAIRELTQKARFSFTPRQFPQSKTFFRLFSAILYAQWVSLEYGMHD